jgi:chromosome segregation ATPase
VQVEKREMTVTELAHDLLVRVAETHADAEQQRAKNAELLKTIKELQTNLRTKQVAINKRDAQIATLKGNVSFYKTTANRYQTDLAEARSMLRKTKH